MGIACSVLRPPGLRTWAKVVFPVLLAGVFLAALSTAAAASTLRRSTSDEPRTVDPFHVSGNAGAAIMYDMFEGLLSLDAQGEVESGAAERFELSEDRRVYTFHLREGLKWSDGKPITSEDFLYSFRRSADPKNATRSARILFPIKNARAVLRSEAPVESLGVSAPDPMTVVIELDEPTAYFPEILASFAAVVVPRHAIEAHGERWTLPQNIVTSGAYVLTEWASHTFLRLKKNPHYHRADSVAIDEVIYYPVEKPATALTRYRAGELDVVFNIPLNQLDWLAKTFGSQLRSSPVIGLFYVLFNNERGPTSDPLVREALSLAIDRDVIANTLLRNGSVPAYGVVHDAMPGYGGNPVQPEGDMAARLERAKKLLAQAGYSKQKPLKIAYKYGGQEVNRRLAVALQVMWRAAGVNVELVNVGARSIVLDAMKGDFMAMRYTYYAPFQDPVALLRLFETGTTVNMSRYANPEFDRRLDEADLTPDPVERIKNLREVERFVMADHPIAPVIFTHRYYLVRDQVQGWVDHVGGEHLSRHLSIAK